MKHKKSKFQMLRGLSVLFATAAMLTIIPYTGAKEFSMMGYKALCPFMPMSTIISFYLAITIHRYLKNRTP